jgi:hypothetical protein
MLDTQTRGITSRPTTCSLEAGILAPQKLACLHQMLSASSTAHSHPVTLACLLARPACLHGLPACTACPLGAQRRPPAMAFPVSGWCVYVALALLSTLPTCCRPNLYQCWLLMPLPMTPELRSTSKQMLVWSVLAPARPVQAVQGRGPGRWLSVWCGSLHFMVLWEHVCFPQNDEGQQHKHGRQRTRHHAWNTDINNMMGAAYPRSNVLSSITAQATVSTLAPTVGDESEADQDTRSHKEQCMLHHVCNAGQP